jgi:uncharacterized protein
MRIRLESARVEPFQWQESIELSATELGLEPDVEVTPVSVRGSLTWAAPSYFLQARLGYRQTVPCDRCLAPVTEALDVPVELLVATRPVAAAGEEGERELAGDEFGVLQVAGEELDTRAVVVEQVQLNLPTHPLCRDDCAGLCPVCGRDRNQGPCGCTESGAEPRWAALAALRDKTDGRPDGGREGS